MHRYLRGATVRFPSAINERLNGEYEHDHDVLAGMRDELFQRRRESRGQERRREREGRVVVETPRSRGRRRVAANETRVEITHWRDDEEEEPVENARLARERARSGRSRDADGHEELRRRRLPPWRFDEERPRSPESPVRRAADNHGSADENEASSRRRLPPWRFDDEQRAATAQDEAPRVAMERQRNRDADTVRNNSDVEARYFAAGYQARQDEERSERERAAAREAARISEKEEEARRSAEQEGRRRGQRMGERPVSGLSSEVLDERTFSESNSSSYHYAD